MRVAWLGVRRRGGIAVEANVTALTFVLLNDTVRIDAATANTAVAAVVANNGDLGRLWIDS